ncbi:MAG TPA: GNAT family N-acetyltransferase [Chthoniobacterales bacterium]|jgi:GNAT superfamily N-acetyltransferase
MTVRRLNSTDAAAYQSLRLLGLQEAPAAFGASYAEEAALSPTEVSARISPAADGSLSVFGAFADQQLVGLLAFMRPVREKLRHCGLLGGMYVAPDFRRLGYGGALLDAVLAHARDVAGVRQVKLTVNATNMSARSLYMSRGFVCAGVEPDALCVAGCYYDEEIYFLRFTGIA